MRARIHFLVKDLLDELESEQIQLGTGTLLRVQELVRLLPDDAADADLVLALAPVLARSAREQALVYEKFAGCQRRADEVFGPRPVAPGPPLPSDAIDQKINASKRWLWAAAALFAAVLAGVCWKFYAVEEKNGVEKSFAVNAGQVSSICPAAVPQLDSLGGKIARFELTYIQSAPPDTAQKMPAGSAWIGSSALADYFVQNDTCLLVATRDSVRAMDSVVLNTVFLNQKTAEWRLRVFISPKIETPVNVEKDTIFRPQIRPVPFDSTHRQALLDLQIQPADPWRKWLFENWPWLRWAIFVPFCALLLAIWRWLEWRGRKLYAQLDQKDKPPYVWNVEIPGAEEVVLDEGFRHTLQVMRRRAQSDAERLDIERTIAATVAGGGLPKFQYRPVSQPVDYLLLLDRQQTGNHRTQLFDAFYRAFKAQELAIERFFYDSDLRVCFNEAHPDGVRLAELAHRYAGARLVLVGSGLQLIHPLRGGLAAWADVFEHWPQRLLLTPKAPEEWARNERLLAGLFQVLPATLQSLCFWVEELEQGEDARFDRWQERVKDVPAAVFQPDETHPLASLLLQFPREVVRWVAACAIYPSLHWDLTLWLGGQLEARGAARGAQGGVLEHDTLLRLFRIRWFVEGQMPRAAREQLLEWLDGEDPALVPALRRDLAAVLAQSPPPDGSTAWADHRLQLVFNRWMGESDRKARKKHEQELARLLPQTDADFVALKYLDAPPTPLHFEVPPALKKYAYRGAMRGLGFTGSLKGAVAAALLALAGLLFVSLWKPAPPLDACAGERTHYTLENDPLALCLKNERDSLIFDEFRLRDSIAAGKPQLVPSVSQKLFNADSALVREVFSDLGAAYYNKGVAYVDRNLRDSACLFFGNALPYAPSDGEYRRAWGWCGQNNAGTPPPQPLLKPVCRQIANVQNNIALRNRLLTQQELNDLNNNQNRVLEQKTSIGSIPLGSEVELLDSNALLYQIRYKGKIGFIARFYQNKPTLVACGTKPQSSVPSSQTPTPVTTPDENTTAQPASARSEPEMVRVRGGTFSMGCTSEQQDCEDNEKPAHSVAVSDFYIGKYEVTQKQWRDIMGSDPPELYFKGCDDCPVESVSWDDIQVFLKKLNEKFPGKNYRLPTEAEWEYAARGGGKAVLFGNGKNVVDPKEINFDGSASYKTSYSVVGAYREKTVPVGSLNSPNALGLHDMSGNVREWCSDWYGADYYNNSPSSNPEGPSSGSFRVLRGGSWFYYPQYCRVAYRFSLSPGFLNGNVGFRLARTN